MEARGWIASAEKVLYCIADAATERLILKLNPDSESLYRFYGEGKYRGDTYQQMVDRTLECVREGKVVCAVYYGHPGIFVNPGHRSVAQARAEGFSAKMLPAISSVDCLFSDIGFDPSGGCQMYEATDLIIRRRLLDVHSHVIIWQIATVGDLGFSFKGYDAKHLPRLVKYLKQFYPPEFKVALYEASQFTVCEPSITWVPLEDLTTVTVSGIHTLYIPPISHGPIHLTEIAELQLEGPLQALNLVPVERDSLNGASVKPLE
jgi:uncharacterized protein YabN with tetrapyrrole methylase and pyrophosphatase domain